MPLDFLPGDRVRVSLRDHWAQGAMAIVREAPEFVQQLVGDSEPWDGCSRLVKTVQGPASFIWVEFDETHRDSDGDGPYSGGEIPADMLTHL